MGQIVQHVNYKMDKSSQINCTRNFMELKNMRRAEAAPAHWSDKL